MRYVTRVFGIFFTCAMFASTVSGESGQQLSSILDECNDCHGKNGVSTESDVPTIAGVSSFFIEEQMASYRDSARPCTESKYRFGDTSRAPTDMCKIANKLSDEQISDISVHYEEQKFVPAKQKVDLAKAAKGSAIQGEFCDKCHTESGSVPEDDAGILAGQAMPYLQQAFKEYRAGKRPEIKKMNAAFEKLKDADFEALIHYYACMGNAQAGDLKPAQCEAGASGG